MHGRVKVRTTAEQEELKKIEKAKKVVQYRSGIDLIFNKRKQGIWDDEILLVSEQMILKNPDIYTLWNIRREAFGAIKWNDEERTEQLKKELVLTEQCLRANPKSYSVWHQRCWVNDHLPEPDWETELSLCAKCLNLDERNFHCWDYRQYLVKKAGIPDDEEFKFSTIKIESNFSNYSSWHYRSLILPKMFPDESEELPIDEKKHTEELDLVMNATFTDPNDTSAWFYQRWLLSCTQKSRPTLWRIKLANHRVVIVFNKAVSLNKEDVLVEVNNEQLNTEFRSYGDKKFSPLWIAKLPQDSMDKPKRHSIVKVVHDGISYPLEWFPEEESWLYKSELPRDQKRNMKQLQIQLDNYKQLAQIEPNNKWALLTGIILMKNIDPIKFHETILTDLDELVRIDKLRAKYYRDLRSKYAIDFTLENFYVNQSDSWTSSSLDLSCLNLTTLYREEYFSFTEEIHLGGNQLGDSLHQLYTFQSCVKLSLSSNGIISLRRFPRLESLRFLSLRNNEISTIEEVLDLVKNNNLTDLDIRDNPVFESKELLPRLANISPTLKVYMNEENNHESKLTNLPIDF